MGCGGSKADGAPVVSQMTATGSGSIIMSRASDTPAAQAREEPPPTHGSLVVSKGGSYVLGRQFEDGWEPGAPITRPENFLQAHHCYIALGPTSVLKLSYSCVSEQGRSPKPPAKPNQDSFVAMENVGGNPAIALFAVFDGHGPKGEDAANYCRLHLPEICTRSPAFARQPFEALRASFEATHKRFTSPEVAAASTGGAGGADASVSGTTAIAVMVNRDGIVCANVGDSRAMMGTLGPRGNIIARPLSIDHKPNRAEERTRIQASSGRILSERQLGIEGGDPDKYYVCRVHNGAIRYGVLFTRSIGDADGHAHLGLTATPELKTAKLEERDKFIVLATDGVWDYLKDEDVAVLVSEADDDAHLAALNVVQTAKACWDRESDKRRDDITAVVVLMRHMSAAAAAEEQLQQQLHEDHHGASADEGVGLSAVHAVVTDAESATAAISPASTASGGPAGSSSAAIVHMLSEGVVVGSPLGPTLTPAAAAVTPAAVEAATGVVESPYVAPPS